MQPFSIKSPVGQQTMEVDPSSLAARISLRPLDHALLGVVGGHYYATAISGVIAASLAANSELFSARWTNAQTLFLLLRLTCGLGVYTAAQTTANPLELEAIIARSFTTDYTTNATVILPASTAQKARGSNMGATFFGSNSGLKICTTTGMTGSVKTLDTAGVGFATYPGNVLGAADTKDLYNWRDMGQHPITLGLNEGMIVRNSGAFGAAATYKVGLTMLWAEVAAF